MQHCCFGSKSLRSIAQEDAFAHAHWEERICEVSAYHESAHSVML